MGRGVTPAAAAVAPAMEAEVARILDNKVQAGFYHTKGCGLWRWQERIKMMGVAMRWQEEKAKLRCRRRCSRGGAELK